MGWKRYTKRGCKSHPPFESSRILQLLHLTSPHFSLLLYSLLSQVSLSLDLGGPEEKNKTKKSSASCLEMRVWGIGKKGLKLWGQTRELEAGQLLLESQGSR